MRRPAALTPGGHIDPNAGLLVVALAHGVVLAILVSALGYVSGGHLNPAVTFGVWIAGKISPVKACLYVVAQLIGAVAAGWVVIRIFFEDPWWHAAVATRPALGAGVGMNRGLAVEAVLTFLLVLVVLGTAVDARAPKIGGLAIGLAVFVDILMGGALTGAAMNPARWFGPVVTGGSWHFENWPVWTVGPLLGGGAAALLYRFVFATPASAAAEPPAA